MRPALAERGLALLDDFLRKHEAASPDAVKVSILNARVPAPTPPSAEVGETAPAEAADNPPASAPEDAPGCSDSGGWPEPLALTSRVEPEPYPLDALPTTIRAAVAEVQAFTKAPTSLVAASALGAVSVAAQAMQDVKRAEKLQGPSGLFLLTIADSGERKTTCDALFTAAIREYERHQAEAAKLDLTRFAADFSAWEAKREGVLAAIKQAGKTGKPVETLRASLADLEQVKPQAPRVPSLMRGDDTPENLAWVLAHKWPSAGVISSEAGTVLGAHGMGKDSIMRNLALLNILWDGGTLKIGRKTSESFTVRGARLTVALQTQEATLRSFFDKSDGLARGTGFLSRFLVAWPESTQGARPFTEAPQAWPALAAFDRRIRALLDTPTPLDADGALIPPAIVLSPEAKVAWVSFHDAIEGELRTSRELYDVRDVAAKAADNAARLAALFQVLEHGAGGAVGHEAFEGAGRIVAWHLNEARRFFGELVLPVELANAARLDTWLVEYCRRKRTHIVPRREIQQYATPGRLREKAALSEALRELADCGRVREAHEGRRKDVLVNPALLARGAA